jgi:hypothetical protein
VLEWLHKTSTDLREVVKNNPLNPRDINHRTPTLGSCRH